MHVPARDFLDKYRCLAVNDPIPLPRNDKEAAKRILRSLDVPDTEWQIGHTQVFLRMSVFDPLESKRKLLLSEKMVIIQTVWRGYRARSQYRRLREATIIIQKHFRGSRQRIRFVRMRKAAITIQAHLRGMFARDFAAALKKKREEEEAEKRRLRRLEEEKMAKERAEKSMEDSYR